jgi:hypothetical protein
VHCRSLRIGDHHAISLVFRLSRMPSPWAPRPLSRFRLRRLAEIPAGHPAS